jgi:hypothetical protein
MNPLPDLEPWDENQICIDKFTFIGNVKPNQPDEFQKAIKTIHSLGCVCETAFIEDCDDFPKEYLKYIMRISWDALDTMKKYEDIDFKKSEMSLEVCKRLIQAMYCWIYHNWIELGYQIPTEIRNLR